MTKTLKLVALALVASLILAACGGDDGGGGGGGGGEGEGGGGTIIHGWTETVISLDPAGTYDLGSWTMVYNLYNGLMKIPPGGNTPEPDLAESCDYDDPKTYTCTLKEGVTFHDGSELTAEDVKFSFDRNIKIADPNGASSLLGAMKEVEVVDDLTVTFHLKSADATWPFILTTGAGAIVPSDVYPDNKLNKDEDTVGTGPYTLAEHRPGEQTVLEANPDYFGDAPANDRVIVQYFDKSSALKLAVEQGEVDIAYRSLTPTDVADLQETEGLEVVEGAGTEIRYLVINTSIPPGDDVAVRQAAAQVIDRQAIAENVYNGTVKPLYSMVPEGLEGHIPAFAEEYGEEPNVDAATQTLEDAGVNTPVELEVWYTPTRYGDFSADEYAEIKRAMEESGLFKVTLKSTEWDTYSTAAFTDKYPWYQLGWFPDYPDADNYVAPFYSKDSFLNIHYQNPKIEEALATEKASTDQAERVAAFEEIQRIAAQDVPIIPIWQGVQIGVVREGVEGVEDTFDPSFTFRYYLISKSE